MSTASLELCKELYELSGWEADNVIWGDLLPNEKGFKRPIVGYEYSLGYLLRKLPSSINLVGKGGLRTLGLNKLGDNTYMADYWRANAKGVELPWYGRLKTGADTPENAACKLAIELFKQGILTREVKA